MHLSHFVLWQGVKRYSQSIHAVHFMYPLLFMLHVPDRRISPWDKTVSWTLWDGKMTGLPSTSALQQLQFCEGYKFTTAHLSLELKTVVRICKKSAFPLYNCIYCLTWECHYSNYLHILLCYGINGRHNAGQAIPLHYDELRCSIHFSSFPSVPWDYCAWKQQINSKPIQSHHTNVCWGKPSTLFNPQVDPSEHTVWMHKKEWIERI